MKFSIGTVLAFAAAVLAKPLLLNSNFQVEEGKPFTLKWSNAQGPVTITLMRGPADNLKPVRDLTSGETGNSYTFTPENLPSDTYAFRISDSSSEPNYSARFQYVGTGSITTTSASLTSTSRSSTSTSASSTTSSERSSTSSATSSTSSTSSGSNSTTSSFTTTTSAPTTTRPAQSTNTPLNSNNAQRFASPLALVLVTVAALVFFH